MNIAMKSLLALSYQFLNLLYNIPNSSFIGWLTDSNCNYRNSRHCTLQNIKKVFSLEDLTLHWQCLKCLHCSKFIALKIGLKFQKKLFDWGIFATLLPISILKILTSLFLFHFHILLTYRVVWLLWQYDKF